MNTTLSAGPHYLLRGFRLILAPGVRRYVFVPVLLNVVVFALLIGFGFNQFGHLIDWLLSFLPGWMDWLAWLLWPLFAVIALVFIFFSFTLLANLIGAPLNGLLAEAVEQHITGYRTTDQAWAKMLAELLPSIFNELKKIAYFIAWAIPLLILFLIPGINLIAPLLWLLFSGWILSLQYLDYPMANHGHSFAEQRRILAQKRLPVLSFGLATLLATIIPFVNFLIMPAAVAGATLMWLELFPKTAAVSAR